MLYVIFTSDFNSEGRTISLEHSSGKRGQLDFIVELKEARRRRGRIDLLRHVHSQ